MATFAQNPTKKPAKGIQIYNYADKLDLNMTAIITTIHGSINLRNRFIKLPYFIGIICGIALDILAKTTNRKPPISRIRVQKFCATTTVNADKAHAIFKAPHTLAEGLDVMIKKDFRTRN